MTFKHIYIRDLAKDLNHKIDSVTTGETCVVDEILNELAIFYIEAPQGKFTESTMEFIEEYLKGKKWVLTREFKRAVLDEGYYPIEYEDAMGYLRNAGRLGIKYDEQAYVRIYPKTELTEVIRKGNEAFNNLK